MNPLRTTSSLLIATLLLSLAPLAAFASSGGGTATTQSTTTSNSGPVSAVPEPEDGPTLTHGEMAYGAGYVAARRFGAAEIVDPRPFAVKSIAATYAKYPKTGPILPAMGYGDAQTKDLETTINSSDVDMVIIGTPIDLTRIIKINKPSQRVRYELQEIGQPTLTDLLMKKFGKKK